MSLVERYAAFVTAHSKLVVVLVLLATVLVGTGAGAVDGGLTITSFESDSPEAAALDEVRANFATEGENTSTVQVVVRGDDVLSRASLLETLRFQQAIRADAAVNDTLRTDRAAVGLSNLVATAAVHARGNVTGVPSLADQEAALESMSAAEVEETLARVLEPGASVPGPTEPYALLPTDYEPGATDASARLLLVFQDTTGAPADAFPPELAAAQVEMADLAAAHLSGDHIVFGVGVVEEVSSEATGESFAIISPVALLLILAVLGLAYRDVVDVLLGLVGVGLVLVWMAGFMGWAGIGLTQILIAVPFLLVGLSIDYALHVVMRYREAVADDQASSADGAGATAASQQARRAAMRRGLAGVVVAIGAATVTTAVGFLANVVSSLPSIREFGLVSGVGIGAAFVVFGLLLPALKLEVDGLLARLGRSPARRAFGRSGTVGDVLGVGATLAERAPAVVLAVALVVSAGGGLAATQVDTTVEQTAFLAGDPPAWMDSLPEPFRPGDYSLREDAVYLAERFDQSRGQSTAEFLVAGPVTDPGTLERLAAGREALADTASAARLADGRLRASGPLETVRDAAAANETVADLVAAADGDGDGVPDENLAAVYDAVYAATPDAAAATIHRADGEYRSLRLTVSLTGADTATVTREMRAVASTVEGDTNLDVTATGSPILQELVQRDLLRTLVEGFLLTFGVILAFLTVIFRRRHRSLALGAVVLLPVVLAQTWLLGTMHLIGIGFTPETAIIAAIGIGIGADYAIHVGERFLEEYDGGPDPAPALGRTVRGTGGALLASAATTAAGFGVLGLALVPSLQRFGVVTAVAIAYAFLASVVLLPTLLALWARVARDGAT